MRYKQNCEKKVQIAKYKLRIIRIKVTICEKKVWILQKLFFYSMAEKKYKFEK